MTGTNNYRSLHQNTTYDMKKIKTLLASDVVRFCKDEKILNFLKATKTTEALHELRKVVAHLKYGQDTVYAAVVLSLYSDPTGVNVLKNYQKYWISKSGIEKLHVRAALILLREVLTDKFIFLNNGMSPELYKEIRN